MPGDLLKVAVQGKHRQVVADTKSRQESIDRSDLYAGTAAKVSQICGLDIVIAVGHKKRNRGEPIQNLGSGFRSQKALQKLLQDDACCHQRLTRFNRVDQRPHL